MLVGDDSPLLLALLALVATVFATLSVHGRRRWARIAGFGLGVVVGAAALVGLGGIAVRILAGPDGVAAIAALVPWRQAPLPEVIRPAPRDAPPRSVLPAGHALSGRVTRVRDGDTIEVAGVPVRFARVDCAERGTVAGDAATRAMRELASGRQVQCSLIGRRSYDREIGTCYLPDGADLGAVLVSRGLCAWR